MKVILTHHALIRSSQRGVSLEEIIDALQFPDQTTTQHDHIVVYKKKSEGYVIVVFAKNEENVFVVISVYKTSKINKYLS